MPRRDQHWNGTDTVADHGVTRMADPAMRLKGVVWMVWGVFFCLAVALVGPVSAGGPMLLGTWGVALPILAVFASLSVQRFDHRSEGRAARRVRRALRSLILLRFLVTVTVFTLGAALYRRGFILGGAGGLCTDVLWAMAVVAFIELLATRTWPPLAHTGVLAATGVWLGFLSNDSGLVGLGVGVGAAWFCRGLVHLAARSRATEELGEAGMADT